MGLSLTNLHHFAWRCRDAEETRAFYEDLLGLPLAHVVVGDNVPSTGEHCPYLHLFFRMTDGNYIAFFDLADSKAVAPDPATPAWLVHFAFEIATANDLLAMKQHLEDNGLDVLGPTDHGFVRSIYFFDPNGLRLEVTTKTDPPGFLGRAEREARTTLDEWMATHHPAEV